MWQPVLMINGYLISVLGVAMLFPAAADMFYLQKNWSPFITSSMVTLFIGISLFLGNRTKIDKISLQQGYLLTTISWVSLTLLASLPFLFFGAVPGFADALFEAMSGLSTTGATVITDLEVLPASILLWRSILNGLGGIGIVIFAVALLPFLGIGGMQIFQRENSDLNDKFMPKFNYIAKRIMAVYFILVALCAGCLYFAGMTPLESVNYAMATIATGGFSTKNASVGFYDSVSIEMILSLFMYLGALPMTFYIMLIQKRDLHSFRTTQVAVFTKILIFYILAVSVWLTWSGVYGSFWQSLRFASFNIISIVTTTGFVSTDYMQWGPLAGTIFIIFALTGGCTGSTSGSVKIFRWQVVWAYLRQSLIVATEPNRVVPIKIGKMTTSGSIVSSVFVFLSAFMGTLVVFTVLVAMTGLDFETAFSAVVACITNSGPGIGPIVGPAGTFAPLSDFAKYMLVLAMLLGRLEVLTVLVIFTKSFWRN